MSGRLGNLTNQVNQLAEFANTGGTFPAAEIMAEFRRSAPHMDDAVRRVAGL